MAVFRVKVDRNEQQLGFQVVFLFTAYCSKNLGTHPQVRPTNLRVGFPKIDYKASEPQFKPWWCGWEKRVRDVTLPETKRLHLKPGLKIREVQHDP